MRLSLVMLGIFAAVALIAPSVLAQGEIDGYLPLVLMGVSTGPTGTVSPTQTTTGTPPSTGTVESTTTPTVTGTQTVEPTGTVDGTVTPTVTGTQTVEPTGTVDGTVTPTVTGTQTVEPTGTVEGSETPTPTGTITAEPTETDEPTETATTTATATAINNGPTPTGTPTNTPTATATTACIVAPADAGFNQPLDIPLDSTVSVTDFVSFAGGDTFDRSRYSVTGMNPNPSLPGGRARLVISVSCFGTGTNQIQITTGGQTFSCGQTVVDREVTADSDTGTINIQAVGGTCTYVQWVLTGTATRID